jgi:hypothetical protein
MHACTGWGVIRVYLFCPDRRPPFAHFYEPKSLMPIGVPAHKPFPASRLLICVDFNGVIHDHSPHSRGFCPPDSPEVPGAVEWLRVVTEEYDACLVSASFRESRNILNAKQWLASRGIPPQWMSSAIVGMPRLSLSPFKFPSLMFIDDRGFCFRGTFPTVSEIKNFRPWNR